MKKSILLFFVLIGFKAFSQWIVQPSGTTTEFHSVYFRDATTGHAVGDLGRILKTTNGRTVGMNDNRQETLAGIFPNPASEFITVEVSQPVGTINGSLVICGINGKEMIQEEIEGPISKINVSSLPAGLCFIRINNREGTAFGKFIKK